MLIQFAESDECKSKGLHHSALVNAARQRKPLTLRMLKGLLKSGSRSPIPVAKTDKATSSPSVPYQIVPVTAEKWAMQVRAARSGGGQRFRNFWFDLTTSLQWTSGVVGIIRAELEMACNLKKIYPALRFSMQANHGFAEIDESQLQWLLQAENVAEAYMEFLAARAVKRIKCRWKFPILMPSFTLMERVT